MRLATALERATGRVLDRLLLLPSAPEKITSRGKLLQVRAYDHGVFVRRRGA